MQRMAFQWRLLYSKLKLAKSAAAMALLLLGGCNSDQDNAYDAFKCAKAATLFGRERDGDVAMRNAIPHFNAMASDGGNPARMAMEWSQRFQDEVPLYRLNPAGQMAALSEVYSSRQCQRWYKQKIAEDVSPEKQSNVTPTAAINLAGCPVPAGISWEEAEKVTCNSASTP